MNGAQRRILAGFAAIFLFVATLVMIANAESTIADLARSGTPVAPHLVWSWEWSSLIGWLSLWPLLWWTVARVRPPRVGWPSVVLAILLGSAIASAWHIGVMLGLRQLYYAAIGAGQYAFGGWGRLLYEYRKDAPSFLQFVGMAAVVQWLITRAADPPVEAIPSAPAPATVAVSDGATKHHLPVDEIEQVVAAGNYVELSWRDRTLLHRATLTAVETALGPDFVRIGRGRLVRRAAIRRVEVDRSGDFTVTLASGAEARGSRRYRAALDAASLG